MQKRVRDALSERLSLALSERDRSLLTQAEYDDRITEIGMSLGPNFFLEEAEPRAGGTRFVVRSALTRHVIDSIEYRRSWNPER